MENLSFRYLRCLKLSKTRSIMLSKTLKTHIFTTKQNKDCSNKKKHFPAMSTALEEQILKLERVLNKFLK